MELLLRCSLTIIIPPHFHVEYENFKALIEITTLAVIAGKLPPRAIGLAMEWATLNQDQLLSMWNNAKVLKPIGKIKPLE